MASLYKRKPSGIYYITGYKNKKKYFISTGHKNFKKAQEHLYLYLEHKSINQIYDSILLKDFIPLVIEYVTLNHRPKTKEIYLLALKSFTNYKHKGMLCFNQYKIKDFTPADVVSWVSELTNHYSITTVNIYIRTIKAAFNFAIRMNYLYDNPFKYIKQLECIKKINIYIPGNHLKLILDNSASTMKDILLFALMTACRRNEILNVRYKDVYFDDRYIHICNHDNFKTKSGKDRYIPLSDELMAILKKYYYDSNNILYNLNPDDNIFNHKSFSVTHYFKKICRKLNLPESYHFHCLRHTSLSNMSNAGASLMSIKDIAGHSDISTTQKYLHSISKDMLSAVNLVKYL